MTTSPPAGSGRPGPGPGRTDSGRTSSISCDVAVIGAGSAGCVAAIAAARMGASVTLVERLNFLGGTSTAVLDTFYAFFTAGDQPLQVVGGLGWEVVGRLAELGACVSRPNSFGSGLGITYLPEVLKRVWDELIEDAGVRVVTGAIAGPAREREDAVTIKARAKGGAVTIRARTLVDASGDGDVASRLGAAILTDTAVAQPATMTFQLANVDTGQAFGALRARPLRGYITDAIGRGRTLPGTSGSAHRMAGPGLVLVAMTRVTSPDPADPGSARAAEVAARRQVFACLDFLREEVPGFGSAVLISTSSMLGVRESRRVLGADVLDERAVLGAGLPADRIALCGAPIEDLGHEPTRWVHIQHPGYYGIPFGCLLPRGLNRTLVAGRCFSATHEAHSSARSMATCMAMGHAAGVAAVLGAGRGVGAVAADRVQRHLRDMDALLEPTPPRPLPPAATTIRSTPLGSER